MREKILDDTYDLNDFASLFGIVKRNSTKVNSNALEKLCELVIYLLTNESKEKHSSELLELIDDTFTYQPRKDT